MDFSHGTVVTVRSVTTTTDDYGDETTVVTEESWGPCAVAPRSSAERSDQNAPAVITAATLYGPSRALDSDDLLVISGHSPSMDGTWQVDGIPGAWLNPFTGWAPGLEVAIKRASNA